MMMRRKQRTTANLMLVRAVVRLRMNSNETKENE